MLSRSLFWSVWAVVVPDKQSGLMLMDLASVVAPVEPQLFVCSSIKILWISEQLSHSCNLFYFVVVFYYLVLARRRFNKS